MSPFGVLLSLVLFVFFYPQLFFALAGRSVDLFQYFGLSYILVRSTTYLGWWLLLVVPLQKSLQRRQWRSTQSPEEEPSDADAAERHVESQENSAGGWGNIAVGTLLLMGGASGQFVLKGTNSSGGLAIFGLFLIGLGIFQMIRSKTSQTQ